MLIKQKCFLIIFESYHYVTANYTLKLNREFYHLRKLPKKITFALLTTKSCDVSLLSIKTIAFLSDIYLHIETKKLLTF
jgi:hypothetical protein